MLWPIRVTFDSFPSVDLNVLWGFFSLFDSIRYRPQVEAEVKVVFWSAMTNPMFLEVVWFVDRSNFLLHCIKNPTITAKSSFSFFPLSNLRVFSPLFFTFSEWNHNVSLKPYLLLSLCQKVICHGHMACSYALQSWKEKRYFAYCQIFFPQYCYSRDTLSSFISLLLTSSYLGPSVLIW